MGCLAFLLALFAEMEHSFTAERAAPARAVAEAKDRRIERPLARPRQLREHVASRFCRHGRGSRTWGTGSGRGTVTPTGHAKPSCFILAQGNGTVSSRNSPAWRLRALLAGLALACKQARRMAMAAATLVAIGGGATCTGGVCGTVSRGAGGRDAVDVAGSRLRLGRAFGWAFTAAR